MVHRYFFFIPLIFFGVLAAYGTADKTLSLSENTAYQKEINLIQIEPGSSIQNASLTITMFPKDKPFCQLVLLDKTLDNVPISDAFPCGGTNRVSLTERGEDALEYNIQNHGVRIGVSVAGDTKQPVPFDAGDILVKFNMPQYFAKITNGTVTNVIVADQNFVNSLSGQWVEMKASNYAGIGWGYDMAKKTFVSPKPYDSWIRNGTSWDAPVSYPKDGKGYHWSEQLKSWVSTP